MKSKSSAEKVAQPATRAGKMRRPEQGNVLWQLYHRLTRFDQVELREQVTEAGFWWSTFGHDSQISRQIKLIPFVRLDLYRSFFLLKGLPDLFDLARQERDETHNVAA